MRHTSRSLLIFRHPGLLSSLSSAACRIAVIIAGRVLPAPISEQGFATPFRQAIIHRMTRRRINRLEERLERLIEGGFSRLFRASVHPREVAVQLAHAIEDNLLAGPEERELAPTQYQIRLNPHDHRLLLAEMPDLGEQLARQVVTYCQEARLVLLSTPEVSLLADADIPRQQVQITAQHRARKHDTTQILEPVQPGLPVMAPPPAGAQLIVDGKRIVALNLEVFNIGRHPDNDLILEDLRVSRHHLQIRLRQGRYLLYDRHSRSGTYVNGQRASEHILSSGDVIRIGGVSLLYLDDEQPDRTMADTQLDLYPPQPPEGSTP